MSQRQFPGRVTERTLSLLLSFSRGNEILGDLIEEARVRVLPNRGRFFTRVWLLKEAARSMGPLLSISSAIPNFFHDIRFALRIFRKRPLFVAVSVTTLGVGIGGATTIYSIADSVLLAKSPYRDPGRLVSVWGTRPDWRGQDTRFVRWDRDRISFDEYCRWRDSSSLFEDVAVFRVEELLSSGRGEGEEERLSVGIASSSLLRVLGVQPSLGRWFLQEEAGEAAEQLAILGHSYWRRRFGADPEVIGSSVVLRDDEDLEGQRFTVIGVAPEDFPLRRTNAWEFTGSFSLWRPADVREKDIWLPLGWDHVREWPSFEGMGRVRDDVSLVQAQAEIEPLIRGDRSPEERGVRVQSYYSAVTAGLGSQVLVLALPSAFLLLIAFSNLAGMFIGEVGVRRHELLTRMALGAGRGRIVIQLLTEAALLGLVGSAVGALLAGYAIQGLIGMAPSASPLRDAAAYLPALTFAILIGVAGTLVFALVPALFTRLGPQGLHERADAHSRAQSGGRIQRHLVTLQIGFTAVMLVQAGLLSRTLMNLSRVELGFSHDDLAVIRFSLPDGFPKAEYVPYFDEILDRVTAIPGVEDVSLSNALPLTVRGGTEDSPLVLPSDPSAPQQIVQRRTVSAGYHTMMEIPLLQGRLLTFSDRSGDRELAAAVVSEYMADAVWPDRSPVGEMFNHMGRPYQVVGIVGDVRHSGPIQGYVSTYYTPYTQRPRNQSFLVARVPVGPGAALGSIDAAIKSIDVPVMTHLGSTMGDLVSRNVTDQRYHAYLALGFGFMAMLLSAAGVLGTAARAVTKRSREIALQKALGAKEGALVWGIVASGARQAIVGTVIGFIFALAGARIVAGFLFGISAADPVTYMCGGLLIILVGIGASFVPAKRITAIDPMQVLKAE